jgi:NADPH:quinone reductase-like Zn-dependent oxidoreductase
VTGGGIVVSSAGPVPADEARGMRTASVWVAPDAAHLADLVARVDDGRLRLHIADRRPLTDLPAVHEDAGNGKLPGKTVIVVGEGR